jgi:hypothetical protein
MDMVWLLFIILIIATFLVLWHEFRQKEIGWSKIQYQIYILVMMFLCFVGYAFLMFWIN